MLTVTVTVTVTASVATSHHSIPSPPVCVCVSVCGFFFCYTFLQCHLHFFRLLLLLLLLLCVCVHVLHQQLLFNVLFPSSHKNLLIEGCSALWQGEWGMGVPARWSQVRIILQTFKNQFQHNTLDKYECKKAATLLLLSLSPSLCLSLPIASPSRVLD